MSQLTHDQYERLERAVSQSQRIAVARRGTEFVLIPLALRSVGGREVIEARHSTTGDSLTLYVDELDSVEAL